MTKEELYDRWIDDFGLDYQFLGVPMEDRKQFFKDLEDWYVSRHIKELNAVKEELMESMREMDEAMVANESKQIGGCTIIGPGQDCLSSELCPYCTDIPKRFLKGYDCYD